MANLTKPFKAIVAIQTNLRGIAYSSELGIDLEAAPVEPGSLDDLALALAAVRTNLLLVEKALNEEDRKVNGPEVRTRQQIKEDILADRELLKSPFPDDSPRTREEIEANIRYDELQLARSHFPGCD